MSRAVNFSKLHVNHLSPELLEPVQKELGELREFIQYYEVDASLMKPYTYQAHLEELQLLSAHYNPEKLPIDFEHLLAGAKDPENDVEQITINLSGVLKSLGTVKEEISLNYLQKIQVALHHMLLQDHSGIGLKMETNSLFASSEEQTEQTIDKDAKVWLDELVKMTGINEIPALVRSWQFYYYLNILKPFSSYNELLAYIACKKILIGDKLDFFSLLNPEKYIFSDKAFLALDKTLAESGSLNERLNADLTGYIECCTAGFRNNISAIRQSVTYAVREQLDYQSLTPRQKNSLNFWLEKAFFIHKDKLDQLTPRQHEMMLLIAKYGSLSNKDLVPVFMVDRKTIQRDFNSLLELKLLDQRGGGRALKYFINLRVPLEEETAS